MIIDRIVSLISFVLNGNFHEADLYKTSFCFRTFTKFTYTLPYNVIVFIFSFLAESLIQSNTLHTMNSEHAMLLIQIMVSIYGNLFFGLIFRDYDEIDILRFIYSHKYFVGMVCIVFFGIYLNNKETYKNIKYVVFSPIQYIWYGLKFIFMLMTNS